jgi:hypothetical protein
MPLNPLDYHPQAQSYPISLPHGSRARRSLSVIVRLLPVFVLLMAGPIALRTDTGTRAFLAATLFLALFTTRVSSTTVLLSLVYLAMLGGLRRWLIPVLGFPGNDPLLLVCPAAVGLYAVARLFSRDLPRDSKVARLVMWLVGVMVLQILNPVQGGIMVGLAGALFYVIPVMWFYIGRELGTELLVRRVFGLIVVVAMCAALYGQYQTWYGFLPAEKEWIRLAHFNALEVRGTIRPFSFFTSPAEYAAFVSIAIVILWGFFLRGNVLAILPIIPLALAVFLLGARGPIVSMLAACTVMWAVKGQTVKTWVPRLVLAVFLAVAGLTWSLNEVKNANVDSRIEGAVAHQTEGLLNVMDDDKSTARGHANVVGLGFLEGVLHPWGYGLGITTMAAGKFGGGTLSSEVDVSNMFMSLGLAGGFLFLALVGSVLLTAFRCWHLVRSAAALSSLGVLFFALGQWLNGGYYCVAMIVWFTIGALDRAYLEATSCPAPSA